MIQSHSKWMLRRGATSTGAVQSWRTLRAAALGAVLAGLILAGCGGGSAAPAAGDAGGQATQPTIASPLEESTATPQVPAAAEAAPDAGPTVAPPDIAEPGPLATLPAIERNAYYDAAPELEIDPAKFYYATIKTNRGDIRAQLFADRAPKTVNNFVFLARQGFYDNTTFHRVLDGFMAQAGDPTGTGAGGPGYEFEDEIFPGLVFDQSGLLAMANRGPATNGSQFFITFGPTDWLNEKHTIFGKVIEGEEVLSKITRIDPNVDAGTAADIIYTVVIEETEASVLPTPSPSPPTPTPTPTPTPFAPTTSGDDARPLAELPAADRANYYNTAPEMTIDPAQSYTATIATSQGVMTATLYAAQAPIAVNNFVVLAGLGFYDNMPVNQAQADYVVVIGSPDNNTLNDVGYRLAAELGQVTSIDPGAIAYVPMEQLPDGSVMSSGSLLLIAPIELPDDVAFQYPFFAQITEGVEVLNSLTMSDTVESIMVTSSAE